MRIPLGLILAVGVIAGGARQTPAFAQAPSPSCVNESLDINIRAQPMEAALRAFSRQTNCPVSGTTTTRGLTSNTVRGVYTPSTALAALVDNRGASSRILRQGFSVERTARVSPTPSRYNCQNESVDLQIAAMPLEEALNALSEATHCPISKSFAVSGLRSREVSGSFTPAQALQAMLVGTGLRGQVIRQGLTVTSPNP